MKFPLSWLTELINTGLSPDDIGRTLTLLGLEVESIENAGEGSQVDFLFDVALTPNLGHCASIVGIARELSAATEKTICIPRVAVKEENNDPINNSVRLTIEDKKGCPRYACRLVKNVVVGPSPEWLQKRLEACGLRSVNNVVDVVNYVVLELGHPLHAFDFDTIEGKEVIARSAKAGEKFATLDGQERKLAEGDIVICDKAKPIALAGIMGGQNSEVSDQTKNVLLEAAYFHPGSIRKTSKRLFLSTDASKRFERGSDPNQLIQSLNRAAMLLQEIAQGKVCTGILDVGANDFPEKKVTCRLSRINHLLGTQLGLSEVENIFKRLNFPYQWDRHDQFTITVPTYRVDVKEEVDLVEEVARIYGYENIEKASHTPFFQASTIPHTPAYLFEQEVKDRLVGEGLQELITCDLIGPTLINIVKDNPMPEEAIVRVLNPTSIEQSVLRTTLLPGLLQVAKYNYDHQNQDFSGFEIGRIHFKEGENYKEQTVAGLIVMGKSHPHHWENKPDPVDFYALKGIIENFLHELNIKNITFKPSEYRTLHPGRQASFFVEGLEIGSFGEVHPSILRRLDVPQRIYFAELSLQDLMQVRQKEQKMTPLPKYPSSERDWTVTVPEETAIASLFTAIQEVDSRLLEEVSLLDLFRSEKVGTGLKNVTFHFVYRDREKTIEQPVVDAEHFRIVDQVKSKFERTRH